MSAHFTLSEMQFSATASRLGLDNTCPLALLPNVERVAEYLEQVRTHFGKPVRVLSCYRAPAVNTAVGGSKTSAHVEALAVDFVVPGVPLVEIAKWCVENIKDFDQIIHEFGAWVHMGFSSKVPRRQVLTASKLKGKTIYKRGLV